MKHKYFVCIYFVLVFFCTKVSAQDINPKDWHNLKGLWQFQDTKNLTQATVGNDLKLVGSHAPVSGPVAGDNAVRVPMGSYYICDHGISPNGGGKGVNQFTMVFDFKIIGIDKWHCFYQTDTTNKNDGECFIRPKGGNIPVRLGVAATEYAPDSIHTNQWYRLALSVNNGGFYRYYLNGKLILEGDTQDIDDRFALLSKVLFFADDYQEDDTIDIASIAIFDTCLSANDILKIGYVNPCTDNPAFLSLGNDTSSCEYNFINKTANAGFAKYEWSTGDNSQSVQLDTSLKSIQSGKNDVWVKATDSRGCEYKDTFEVDFLAAPPIVFNIKNEICKGKNILINAGDINFQYEWKELGSGNIYSTNSAAKFDSAGLYKIKITSTNTCISEETIEILVNQNPPKPMIIVNGHTTICAGDSLLLKVPAVFSGFNWSNGETTSDIFIKKDSKIYLTVTDNKGCESPVSDTVTVKIQTLPAKPQIKLNGKSFFCNGDSVELEAPANYARYVWSDSAENLNVNYITREDSVTVQVIDSIGCKSPVSNPVKVVVYPLPASPVIQLTGDTAFCEGKSAMLSVPSGKQYIWNDGQTVNQRTIMQSGNYYVVERDINNCKSLPSDSVTITVYTKPSTPVISPAGNIDLCEGDNIDLSVPAGSQNYFWSDSSHQHIINIDKEGTYTVMIQDSNGCLSNVSDPVNVKSIPLPNKPSISSIGTTKLQCFENAQRYRWYKDGNLISDTVKTINVSSQGYYQVQVSNNGCWSEPSDSFNYNFSGIKNIRNTGLHVYPNPAGSSVNIQLQNIQTEENLLIQMIDLQGKLILESHINAKESKSEKNINIEKLNPGIYFIKISNSEILISGKIEKL